MVEGSGDWSCIVMLCWVDNWWLGVGTGGLSAGIYVLVLWTIWVDNDRGVFFIFLFFF